MIRFLWAMRPYFRQVAGELILGSLAGIAMNTLVVLPAILLGRAIDVALAFWRHEVDARAVVWASLIFIGGTLATEAPRVFKRWFLITANARIRANLRADLLRGVLAWPMARIHTTPIGDLMARIDGDVETMGLGVRRFIIETWDTALFTLSFVVAMVWYDASLTLLALAPTPFATLLAYYSGKWVRGRTTKARQANSVYIAELQEQLAGIRVMRLFGRAQHAIERIISLSWKQADANIARERLRVGLQMPYIIIITLGVILLVWDGSNKVFTGIWTVGAFVAYLELYLRAINRGFREIPVLINQVQASAAIYARLQPMLAPAQTLQGEPPLASFRPSHIVGTRDGRQETDDRRPMAEDRRWNKEVQSSMLKRRFAVFNLQSSGPRPLSSVSLQHVTFRYPNASEPALRDICLDIPAGALVAVTGPVGAGKSALARALLGIYPIESGQILFDNAESPTHIGYLPQEPFLFSGAVRENIAFGSNDFNRSNGATNAVTANISDAIALAALDADMRTFPAGLDTPIGEMGIRVSGGQRQRIALARSLAAFAPHMPNLLVLDDPFSAVDLDTEARIVANLREAFGPLASPERRATIVLCSHRLAAFPHADHIIVLDAGRIVAQGTHTVLMQQGGLYARIYNAQQKVSKDAIRS